LPAAVVAEANVVWRVGECHGRVSAGEHPLDVFGLGRVADQQAMLTECPQFTRLGAR
jgi:hypothetical protein